MNREKIIHYKEFGDVLYHKSPRARNISIRISNEGRIRVTVPRGCDVARAEQFLWQKSSWIHRKQLQIERINKKNLVWKPGDQVGILGGSIFIQQGRDGEYQVKEEAGRFLILVPLHEHQAGQEKKEISEIMASIGLLQAKRKLPGLLEQFADKYGYNYSHVTIRRMKTRWGSCSPANRISLNSSLVFLPPPLIEYVCLHELVHTIHKHHGKSFWDEMVRQMPDTAARRRALRSHAIIA